MENKNTLKLSLDKNSLAKNQNLKEDITTFLDPKIDLTEELKSIGIINNFMNFK